MKRYLYAAITLLLAVLAVAVDGAAPLRVVTTLPDYAVFAGKIGGERVSVKAIVLGNQDAHFIRPKPSFVNLVRNADMLISTGLDLELWVPTIVDKSGNSRVRSGQRGYVSAAHGMTLLEKPGVMSRIEGGLHIHGNPHVTSSPVQMKTAARNIASGLVKNDPEGKEFYLKNLKALQDELDRRLFGEELVTVLGGERLSALAEEGKLISFLDENELHGKPLADMLGGWMKDMLPLRGASIVTYHKNWVYFLRLFGLREAGTIEPKPGIPPSPKHVTELVNLMREQRIRIILAANYFDEHKIRTIAAKVDAEAVIVPVYVGGVPEVDNYMELVDTWVESLLEAARKTGMVNGYE